MVEDNRVERFLLQKILEKNHDYVCITADDGLEAWEALQGDLKPDVCIVDILMPRMDGYELIERIRSHPKLKKTPIIVCTAIKDHFKIKQIQALDISGCIVKPHTTKVVLDEVEKALERQTSRSNSVLLAPIKNQSSADISVYLDQLKAFARETEGSIALMKASLSLGDRANIASKLDQLEQSARKLGVTGFLRVANKLEDHILTRDETTLSNEIDYLEKERYRIAETLAFLLDSSEEKLKKTKSDI